MAQALGSSVLLDNTRFRQHLNHGDPREVFTVAGETSPHPQGDKFMSIERCKLTFGIFALMCVGVVVLTPRTSATSTDDVLNEQLVPLLSQHGFTGRVGLSLEQRLGRKIDNQLADWAGWLFMTACSV